MDSTEEFRIMTRCCHGELYEKCVYGCTLWEFSRTYRRHIIRDGNCYGKGCHVYLWEICSAAPCGFIQAKYGYDLYYKGKLVKHEKTVKKLKEAVMKKLSPPVQKRRLENY